MLNCYINLDDYERPNQIIFVAIDKGPRSQTTGNLRSIDLAW